MTDTPRASDDSGRQQQELFPFADKSEWEQAADDEGKVAELVFNLPFEGAYSYDVPDALAGMLEPGQRVKAPLGRGNRSTVGYCVNVSNRPAGGRRLKAISEILDREPLVDHSLLSLTRWIAERYLCGWGQVLDSIIPAGVRKRSGTREVTAYTIADELRGRVIPEGLPAKQRAILAVLLSSHQPITVHDLCEQADCGTSPVTSLRNKGLIRALRIRTEISAMSTIPDVAASDDLRLSDQQSEALDAILACLREGVHRTQLLHGVTGSGKTEVYIQAIREVVSYGRQAIVLVPEISLTPQTIRRFKSRFGSVAVLHSHMSPAERHWQWQQIARGAIQVVVGARSAVFAPTPQLGLIVIDEEHEPTFKQDSTPRYHAREVARFRCQQASVPLVLGSATPTLESWLRATRGQDQLISMPDRIAGLPLPPVIIVDTRNDPRVAHGSAIGRPLFQAITRALKDKGQVILFLNLRGFSPTVWCRGCGESIRCPDCDISLTWHKDRAEVMCHFCDYSAPPPERCPKCESPAVRYFGTGTQKLEAEVRALFRDAKVLRMDSDTMKRHGSHDEALESFRSGDVDILLGTQMIAKGLDFPNVTLVGVVDADTMRNQPDPRAAERTFQLIAQVAGRTGRSKRGGRVLVQTTSPEDASIRFASKHDFPGFARYELAMRNELRTIPFTQVARVIFRGPKEELVGRTASDVASRLRAGMGSTHEGIRILGAAPAPVTRLRGLYRFHLQISGNDPDRIRDLWRKVEKQLELPEGVECTIDVDPVNMR